MITEFIAKHGLRYRFNNLFINDRFRIWLDDKITIYYQSKLIYQSSGLSEQELKDADLAMEGI